MLFQCKTLESPIVLNNGKTLLAVNRYMVYSTVVNLTARQNSIHAKDAAIKYRHCTFINCNI